MIIRAREFFVRAVRFAAIAAAGFALLAATSAQAGITFDGSVAGTNGTNAATAYFQQSGSNLLLTVTNTRTSDVTHQSDVLTGVFFDLTNGGSTITTLVLQDADATGIYRQNSTANTNANGTLVAISESNLAAPGSTNGGPGAFVGGWQYRMVAGDLAGLTQSHGLGTIGFNIFNGNQVKNIDNHDYGLTAAGDNVATSQAKQMFNYPLIKNSITFTFSGLPTGFTLATSNLTNVRFQYATSLTGPNFTDPDGTPDIIVDPDLDPVPEPGSLIVFATLFAGAGAARMRRRQIAG